MLRVMRSAESAAEKVTTLNVEPGSYASCTAALRVSPRRDVWSEV